MMRMGIQLPDNALDVLKQVGAGFRTGMYVPSWIWPYDIGTALVVSSFLFCSTINPWNSARSQLRHSIK